MSIATVAGMQGRYRFMDLLRGGAVLLVVLHHAATIGGIPSAVHLFNDAVGTYRLPALFLASGLLLSRSLAKGPKRYWSGKLRHLIWPYLVWTVLMLSMLGWSRGLDPVWWIYPRGSHTWFLFALAVLYALGSLTRYVPPGWLVLGCLVASQLIDRGAFPAARLVHDVTWYGVFFFLGAVLARHIRAVVSAPAWVFALGASITLLWTGLTVSSTPPAAKSVLAAVMTSIGIVTIVWALSRLPVARPLGMLEGVGRRSIVTYLVHLPVMKFAAVHLDWPGGWAGYLSLVTVTLLVCALATRHYSRIRWLFEWPGPAPQKPVPGSTPGPAPAHSTR